MIYLLTTLWDKREQALYGTEPDRVLALATLPYGDTTHMGKMSYNEPALQQRAPFHRVSMEGNCDIKDLSRGSKVYFPVYVEGGSLSVGDLHCSQGDGKSLFVAQLKW